MGYIYVLTAPHGKQYIGQTKQTPNKRWKQHKALANSKKAKEDGAYTVLIASIKKYGAENFKVEILLECANEDMNKYEIDYITKLNTRVPNGLNIKAGGEGEFKEFSQSRKMKVSKARKKNDLPMYVIERRYKGILFGYRVCNHPNGTDRDWISSNNTMEEKLQKALDYVKYLDSLDKPLKPKENTKERGISIFKNGYRVRYADKDKHFMSTKYTNEENYSRALSYLNMLKADPTIDHTIKQKNSTVQKIMRNMAKE